MIVTMFTKESPQRLNFCLRKIGIESFPIVVIDDSYSKTAIDENKKLCKEVKAVYHGKKQQQDLLSKVQLNNVAQFVRSLGSREWNLGCNRNYAIIYSLLRGHKQLLMIDDDMLLKKRGQLTIMEQLLKKNSFVAAEITGMPDDSIVGHLFRQNGTPQFKYQSGSCLGINLDSVTNHFINDYNEDWIWLFLENQGQEVPVAFKIEQLKYGPFKDIEKKLLFQEFGEILWEGIRESSKKGLTAKYITQSFWNRIINERKKQICLLGNYTKPSRKLCKSINERLTKYLNNLNPSSIVNTMKKYKNNNQKWNGLLLNLRSK